MSNKIVKAAWEKIKTSVKNYTKVYLLTYYVDKILKLYEKRISNLAFKYSRFLPYHVAQTETDDLKMLANLEFVEVMKVWDPEQNDALWPLARVRMLGAMKDHIRHVTKSDPTRLYDWITEAAQVYISVESRADFENKIETGHQLNEGMKALTPREKQIVIDHTTHDMTFKEIGKKIELSESQVSRVYKKSIEKMRKVLMPKRPLLH